MYPSTEGCDFPGSCPERRALKELEDPRQTEWGTAETPRMSRQRRPKTRAPRPPPPRLFFRAPNPPPVPHRPPTISNRSGRPALVVRVVEGLDQFQDIGRSLDGAVLEASQ